MDQQQSLVNQSPGLLSEWVLLRYQRRRWNWTLLWPSYTDGLLLILHGLRDHRRVWKSMTRQMAADYFEPQAFYLRSNVVDGALNNSLFSRVRSSYLYLQGLKLLLKSLDSEYERVELLYWKVGKLRVLFRGGLYSDLVQVLFGEVHHVFQVSCWFVYVGG